MENPAYDTFYQWFWCRRSQCTRRARAAGPCDPLAEWESARFPTGSDEVGGPVSFACRTKAGFCRARGCNAPSTIPCRCFRTGKTAGHPKTNIPATGRDLLADPAGRADSLSANPGRAGKQIDLGENHMIRGVPTRIACSEAGAALRCAHAVRYAASLQPLGIRGDDGEVHLHAHFGSSLSLSR